MLFVNSFQILGATTKKDLSSMSEELERDKIKMGEEADQRKRLG